MTQEQIAAMAPRPIVFALSNPDPEITPALAHAVRADLVMATGRSDYPNQVNNVLCFPYIFRGALDVRARRINEAMKLAAVYGIQKLAKLPILSSVRQAYQRALPAGFSADYILPTPLDPRLRDIIPALVAQAAIDTGVARLPYPSHYPSPEAALVLND